MAPDHAAPTTAAPREYSRRSIAKGAAWAAPIILASTAAPAFAASCQGRTDTASWAGFQSYSNGTFTNSTSQTVSPVTITASNSGATSAPGNWSKVTYLGTTMLELASVIDSGVPNSQDVTITFSQGVQNLSFTIYDIDGVSSSASGQFWDRISIPVGAPRPTRVVAGSQIIGDGTPGNAWRPSSTTPASDGAGTNNVTLTYSGLVTSVTFSYSQNVYTYPPSAPAVWVGPLTYSPTIC